ncbi:hypothetical protein AB0M39_04400 [Streptomyces sp. NPDC051907]|uniref:hypothetical protein n=1 Tax=Streptomyces sp. NPDC051907 TaxID=3155284 RepID=UPI00341F0FCD
MSVSLYAKTTAVLMPALALLVLAAPGQAAAQPTAKPDRVMERICGMPLPKPVSAFVGQVMCVNGWQ